MRIRVTHPFLNAPMLRQTPGEKGIWEDCQFVINEPMDECDAWIVIEGFTGTQACNCPAERTIFMSAEPPSEPRYPKGFLAQFAVLLTSHHYPWHPKVIHRQQGLAWWAGVRRQKYTMQETLLNYDMLAAMPSIEKSRNISVICSNVDLLSSHRQRIRFVERLYRHFGSEIDFFGEGWRPIHDKWDAIAPYRYHVAIENGNWPDYWSEKLSDAFLGGALPIYGGCPNIQEYFDPRSMLSIDITRPDQAIQMITKAIQNNLYETNRDYVWQSRTRVLNEHNFFPMAAALCRSLPAGKSQHVTLKTNFSFSVGEQLQRMGLKMTRDAVRLGFRTQRRLKKSPFTEPAQPRV